MGLYYLSPDTVMKNTDGSLWPRRITTATASLQRRCAGYLDYFMTHQAPLTVYSIPLFFPLRDKPRSKPAHRKRFVLLCALLRGAGAFAPAFTPAKPGFVALPAHLKAK